MTTAQPYSECFLPPIPAVDIEVCPGENPSFFAFFTAAQKSPLNDWLIAFRRELHKRPELAYEEYNTSALIQKALKELKIQFSAGWGVDTLDDMTEEVPAGRLADGVAAGEIRRKGGTGILAQIGTGKAPCVALRADMDALPIEEKTDISFRSLQKGKMHACGHDAHITMLVGAAILLKAIESRIQGTVKLIFQPAEEGGIGAAMMVREKVLEKEPPVQWIFGHHVWPAGPTGSLATKPLAFFGGCDSFEIIIEGKGGHAANPRACIDAAPAVAAVLQSVFAIGAREVSRHESEAGLISITAINGGTAFNIIPPNYKMMGTLRAFSSEATQRLKQRLQEVVEYTAKAHRCKGTVIFGKRSVPPVVNDKVTTRFYMETMAEASSTKEVTLAEASLPSEDFSYFQAAVPGTFAFIGTGSGGTIPGHPPTNLTLHSDAFALDERVLPRGSAMEAYLALQAVEYLAKASISS